MLNNYVCLKCYSKLEYQEDSWRCISCKQLWPIIEGISIFSENTYYWNHIPKERMVELIKVAKGKGYKIALKDILLNDTNNYIYRLASEESRADFSVLLDLDKSSKVLDIGCSWGSIALGLGRRCGELHAIDCSMESLKFVKIRAEQESLYNLKIAKVDPLDFGKLPYSDSCFDVIVLNGVLEWIGSARTDLPLESVRTQALQEIKRVLKADGRLYIGIENRFSILYFLGAVDHHGLPFTSILPRYLSNTMMRLLKKREYRTYTYSFWGYKKILQKHGFESVNIYLPLPTYHHPYYLISIEAPFGLNFFWSSLYKKNDSPSVKKKIAFAISSKFKYPWIYKILSPSFSIVAMVKS